MSSVVARAARLLPGRQRSFAPDYAAVLSALPGPVVLLDADNRFRCVNLGAEQFLGHRIKLDSEPATAEGDLVVV